jgi:hypothetical protein
MVATVLIAVGAAAMLVFVVLYAVGSRGWYRTAVGRNLMALPAVLAALLLLWLARRLVAVPDWVWWGGLASLDAVMWWRVAILWRLQRRNR